MSASWRPDRDYLAAAILAGMGTLGGPRSGGYGINTSGQVTGAADISGGFNHAFLYSSGTMTDLGILGGEENFSQTFSIRPT